MIDALFGSKTRVKLLHLFLNNPGKAFYVREITRLIDEQINSVRRELANMLEVGIITSKNTDNKLYYEVNQRYDFYQPFRMIFGAQKVAKGHAKITGSAQSADWQDAARHLHSARVVVAAGSLVPGSASKVDLLVVGDVPQVKVKALVSEIESVEGRVLTYSVLTYDEFYYRLSVRDRFISDILASRHVVLVDSDDILKQ